MDKERSEELLNKVQGHLILWPYDWFVSLFTNVFLGVLMLTDSRLEKEEQGGNWLYALDQISPLEI